MAMRIGMADGEEEGQRQPKHLFRGNTTLPFVHHIVHLP